MVEEELEEEEEEELEELAEVEDKSTTCGIFGWVGWREHSQLQMLAPFAVAMRGTPSGLSVLQDRQLG